MKNWLKKQLGIDQLETQLTTIKKERDELKEKVEIKDKMLEEISTELQVHRKKEEADKAKYESNEPWVEIRSEDFHPNRGFRIELDWNDAFIEQLKDAGIKGKTDEEVIQKWLALLYQNLIERLEATIIEQKDEAGTANDFV